MKTYILLFTLLFVTLFRASAQTEEGCVILESDCFNIKYKGAVISGDKAILNFTVTAKCAVPFNYVHFQIPETITPTDAQNGNSSFVFTQTTGTHSGSPAYRYLRFTATEDTKTAFSNNQSDVFTYSIPRAKFESMDFMYITVSGGTYTFTVCINPRGCSITEQIPDPLCEFTTSNGGATFGFIDAKPINGTPRTKVRFKVKNNNSSPIHRVQVEANTRSSHLSVAPQNSLGQYAYIYLWEPNVTDNKIVTYTKVNSEGSTGMEEDVLTFIISSASLSADPAFKFTLITEGNDFSTISLSNIKNCSVVPEQPGCVIVTDDELFTFTYLGAIENTDNTSSIRFSFKNSTATPISFASIEVQDAPQPVEPIAPDGFIAEYDAESGLISYIRVDGGTTTGNETKVFGFTLPTSSHELLPFYTLSVFTDDAAGFTGFNTLTCDDTPIVPLPVELASFEGKATASGIALTWTTASEKNSDRFEVQHSTDGKTYATIGTVKGAGNASTSTRYSFTDTTPANGTNYYRLKQVDTDETVAYSNTIALESTNSIAASSSITVYPNPVTGNKITVALNNNSIGSNTIAVSITDMNGRTVFEKVLSATNSEVNVSLPELKIAKGLYFVKVQGDNKVETQKLIVR